MFKLLKYLKQYKKQTILGPIFKLIEALLELCIPLLMAALIDDGIKNSNHSLVFILGGIMLAVAITGAACSFTCQYYASVASQGFGTNVRNAMFKKVSTLTYSQLDALPPSALITRMTSDINQVQLGVAMFIRLATRIPFLLICGLVLAMTINFKLSLILLCAIPVFALVVFLIMRKTIPQYKRVQEKLDNIGKAVKENLAGQRVIRAFNKEEEELSNSLSINNAYAKTSFKSGKFSALFNPLTLIIINFCIVLILWFGGVQINIGTMTQGQVIAFINYVNMILSSLIVLSNIIIIFTKALASASRVLEIFEIEEIRQEENQYSFDKTKPFIEFKNVSFNYHKSAENEINNISFSIFDKQSIGIIGPTGSGKTTLINLLQGFYKATEGEILIYGVNVNLIDKASLQQLFGLVPQKSLLFSGTVKDNIKIGKQDATDDEIIEACKIAQADKFVTAKENGYNSLVNAGGSNFSGGQKQRLCIARAVVKNPPILILDDAGSALDYSTELRLRKALKKYMSNSTVINISQRIFSIKDSDLILVLKNGSLEGAGSHDELIKNCKVYEEFNNSQVTA